MIEKKIHLVFIFFNLLLPFSLLPAQSLHELLRKGDRRYDAEQYKAAEKHYRDAADLKYGDPVAAYNLGNSLYQQGNWDDAATRFEQTLRSTLSDTALKADALHNLGNTFLKRQKFKEAVEAYENSLRLRPGDPDTKRNLQLAKKKLEKEEEERKQKEKEKEKQQQSQTQQDPNQQQDQNQQQEQPPQQQNQPQQPNQGTPQDEQNQQPKPNNEQRLKKEEARRLLETFIGQEDQKNARKYREQRQQPKSSGKEKDW